MRRTVHLGEQHISLPTAAAIAYREIMGEPLAPTETVDVWNDIVHAVAHALSNTCPLYSTTDEGTLVQIAHVDLVHSRFERGAAILRMANGTVHRRLTISRNDLHAAVTILRRIGARFDKRPT